MPKSFRSTFRSRRVVGTTTKLTKDDWSKIFAHKWPAEYRLALEVIRDNGNKPILGNLIEEKAPGFYVRQRDRINDIFRRIGMPFFVINVNHGIENASLQVVHR